MPYSSRNIDQRLVRAGPGPLPDTGVSALDIWPVTGRAGANFGMSHSHFKTRDAFVNAILCQVCDGMFTRPTLGGEVFGGAAISRRIDMALEDLAKGRPSAGISGDRK